MANTLSPQEFLSHCTVRILCDLGNGKTSTGTGFFFAFDHTDKGHIPAIVTNKHVIQGAQLGKFVLNEAATDGTPMQGKVVEVILNNFEARWIQHPDPQVDLCVLPTAPLHKEAEKQSKKLFYTALRDADIPTGDEWNQLTVLEEIVMVGYPIGIWDSHNNMPILRRGITATHPKLNYEGRSEFIIDAACFPGSSGSPVFLFNFGMVPISQRGFSIGTRLKLLGVLYAGPQYNATGDIVTEPIPTHLKQIAVSSIPTNLGFVIKSTNLTAFTDIFRKAQHSETQETA